MNRINPNFVQTFLKPFYPPRPDPGHGTKIITAAGSDCCLNQAFQYALEVELGISQWVRSADLRQLL